MNKSLGRLTFSLITVTVTLACTQADSVTDPQFEVSAARPVGGPVYVAQEVGFLPGDVQSEALGVNDLGYVVGTSYPASSVTPWNPHAFLRAGNTMIPLSMSGSARAVSNGTLIYIGGDVYSTTTQPARWTYDPSTGSVTEQIVGSSGSVEDINDLGTMIGNSAGDVTLWFLDGLMLTFPPVSGFTSCRGKGINNDGDYTMSCSGNSTRGIVSVGNQLFELPPAPGHSLTFAGEISDRLFNHIYVSGVSAGNVDNDYHLARWEIDLSTGTIRSVEALSQVSEGRGVTTFGVVPGQTENKGKSSGIAWTLDGTIDLKPTKGGSLVTAQDISGSAEFIVGSAAYKGFTSRALLWTLQQ